MGWKIDPCWYWLNKTVFLLLNIVGWCLGYSSCQCGANWWWVSSVNPGWLQDSNSGFIMCDHCYEYNRSIVDTHNREITRA
jgi:hypothetical protein